MRNFKAVLIGGLKNLCVWLGLSAHLREVLAYARLNCKMAHLRDKACVWPCLSKWYGPGNGQYSYQPEMKKFGFSSLSHLYNVLFSTKENWRCSLNSVSGNDSAAGKYKCYRCGAFHILVLPWPRELPLYNTVSTRVLFSQDQRNWLRGVYITEISLPQFRDNIIILHGYQYINCGTCELPKILA